MSETINYVDPEAGRADNYAMVLLALQVKAGKGDPEAINTLKALAISQDSSTKPLQTIDDDDNENIKEG